MKIKINIRISTFSFSSSALSPLVLQVFPQAAASEEARYPIGIKKYTHSQRCANTVSYRCSNNYRNQAEDRYLGYSDLIAVCNLPEQLMLQSHIMVNLIALLGNLTFKAHMQLKIIPISKINVILKQNVNY